MTYYVIIAVSVIINRRMRHERGKKMKKKWLSTLLLAGLLINVPYIYAEEALVEETPSQTTSELEEKVAQPENTDAISQEVAAPAENLSNDAVNQVILTLNSTKAIIYGQETTLSSPPKVVNGTTLLPFRFAVEQVIGGTLKWDQDTQTITINKDNTEVIVVIGENKAWVDGLEVEL